MTKGNYAHRIVRLQSWHCAWVITLFLCLYALPAMAAERLLPFAPGEKLTFQLKWAFIKAGKTTLSVEPSQKVEGVMAHHLVMSTRTTSFVDKIYKVRNRVDSFVDNEVRHSLLFAQRQREGRTKRNIVVRFDWETEQAFYTKDEVERDPINLLPGTVDPLASFYYLRTLDLKENMLVERPITDGKKNVVGWVHVWQKETITVPAGTFETYRTEPVLRDARGVFEKSSDSKMTIWVTADWRHIPVKIKSKVAVGSFVAELIKMEGILAEPIQAESVQIEPIQSEPAQAEPIQAEPVQVESIQAEPSS